MARSRRGSPRLLGAVGRRRGDPAGAGAAGVDDAQHPPVAFGPPLLDRHVLAPGAGPPVDRARIVADDVVAQRVELGALARARGSPPGRR